MGETTHVTGKTGERQLQIGRVDTDEESSVERGVRGEHVVHAVQQEQRRTVPGRLGEQAVHQSIVHASAASQKLSLAVRIVKKQKINKPKIVDDNIIHKLWLTPHCIIFLVFSFHFFLRIQYIKTRRFVPHYKIPHTFPGLLRF